MLSFCHLLGSFPWLRILEVEINGGRHALSWSCRLRWSCWLGWSHGLGWHLCQNRGEEHGVRSWNDTGTKLMHGGKVCFNIPYSWRGCEPCWLAWNWLGWSCGLGPRFWHCMLGRGLWG